MASLKFFNVEFLSEPLANVVTPGAISDSDVYVRQMTIYAPNSNTGVVYVSDSLAHLAGKNAVDLVAGQSVTFKVDSVLTDDQKKYLNMADIYAQKTVGRDKIIVMFYRQTGINYRYQDGSV